MKSKLSLCNVWRNIDDEIKASGLPQYAWLQEVGITKDTFRGWKNDGKSPTLPTLLAIAEYCNKSLDWFLIDHRWGDNDE